MLLQVMTPYLKVLGELEVYSITWRLHGDSTFRNLERVMVPITTAGTPGRFRLLTRSSEETITGRFEEVPPDVEPGCTFVFEPGDLRVSVR